MFVVEGSGQQQAIESMPGINRFSIDTLLEEAQRTGRAWYPRHSIVPVLPMTL